MNPMINEYHINGPALGRIRSHQEQIGRLQNHSRLLSALWNCLRF